MPASNSFPSASVKPRSAISPRSSGLLIFMTSVQCPSPSAPIFTNLKIQATRPPQSKNRREKYPFGAPTPNLEPVPSERQRRVDDARQYDQRDDEMAHAGEAPERYADLRSQLGVVEL